MIGTYECCVCDQVFYFEKKENLSFCPACNGKLKRKPKNKRLDLTICTPFNPKKEKSMNKKFSKWVQGLYHK